MRTGCFKNRFSLVTALILLAAGLYAQEKGTSNSFVPEVRQKGKDVVWIPTPPELIDLMLSMAKVTPDDYVIDLGSGDGRMVIAAARLGAHAQGIEYNHDLVSLSEKNAIKEGVSGKTEFIEADFFQCDLSRATVITIFLLPEINRKLKSKFLDLRPGTRIISNTFPIGNWIPDEESTTGDDKNWNRAMLWIVPAKIEGSWKLGNDNLTIKQKYQVIHGYLNSGETRLQISDCRLKGSEITFRIGGDLYAGHVEGTKMCGTITSNGNIKEWKAEKSFQ